MAFEWGPDPDHQSDQRRDKSDKVGSCLLRAIVIVGLGSFLLYGLVVTLYSLMRMI